MIRQYILGDVMAPLWRYAASFLVAHQHRRSMEKEAKANSRRCFMGENCRTHGFFRTV